MNLALTTSGYLGAVLLYGIFVAWPPCLAGHRLTTEESGSLDIGVGGTGHRLPHRCRHNCRTSAVARSNTVEVDVKVNHSLFNDKCSTKNVGCKQT